MTRRKFFLAISGAVALLAGARSGHAERSGQSAAGFVETTYKKQARLQNAETPPGQAEYYALFSRGMRRLIRAPHHFPKNMLFGPVLNAFFGWGVFPGIEVKVGKVTLETGDDSGPATIRVEIEHHGEPHKVWVRIVNENDDWRIANISYDYGKSLVEHYRAFTRRR